MKREYDVKIHRKEYAVGFFYVLDGAKTKGRSKKLDPMCHGGRNLAFLFRKYLHTSTWSDRLSVRDQQKKNHNKKKYLFGYSKQSKFALGKYDFCNVFSTCNAIILLSLGRNTIWVF